MNTASTPFRGLGTVLSGVAVVILAVAMLQPSAMPWPPGPAGLRALDLWFTLVFTLALLVAGYSLRRDAPAFAALAFVFLTGGAAQLYLTEPFWFASFRLRPQTGAEWLMLAFLVLEAVVTAAALMRIGVGRLLAEASGRLGMKRLALLLVVTAFLSVPVLNYASREAPGTYLAHVLVAGFLFMLHLAALVAMSQVPSPVSGMHRLRPVVPAAFTVLVSLALGLLAFQEIPHSELEFAYLFQARIFAEGWVAAPAPPDAALGGLSYFLTDIRGNDWFAAVAPGWPVILAAGLLTGTVWLINPVLAGISVLLAYDIADRKAGRDQADLVALMMASSPWLLAAAGSLSAHTLTLVLVLAGWSLILRAERPDAKTRRRLILAGLAFGVAILARPYDAALVTALTLLWLGLSRKGALPRIGTVAIGLAPALLIFTAYNYRLTGDLLTTPVSAYLDALWPQGANAFGFGSGVGAPDSREMLDLWPGHSPAEAILNTANQITSLQFEMLGWSVGSLALVFAYLLWQRTTAFDAVMMTAIGAVILGSAFYWYADTYYLGPRYLFLAVFPVLFLSARGYEALRAKFPGRDGQGFIRIDSILGLCCLFGLLVFAPWRGVVKYHQFGGFYTAVQEAAKAGEFGDDIVLVNRVGNIGAALMLNAPDLSGPVFLEDTGTLDLEALEAAFPGRTIRHYTPERDH
ncbi:MAG: DUF2142 domain-containing protein [Rhodobacteraceae bacterium]|nr:DUF2142 domain-containing protein [Paracoccaceae bacterium]